MARIDRLAQSDVVAALPRLRRYARVLVGDADDADELVRDTLARAWKGHQRRPAEIALAVWLFGVMHATHRRRPGPTDDATSGSGPPAEPPSHHSAAAGHGVRDCVASLPLLEREVLMLAAVERLPYADIAALLDVSIATVMSTLARARAHVGAMNADDPGA